MSKTKTTYTPTPNEILPHIEAMFPSMHCAMLDPFAGDGKVLDYLSKKMHLSQYGVESDPELFAELKKNAKAMNEDVWAMKFQGFRFIYVSPPRDDDQSYIKMIYKSLVPEGYVVWRLPENKIQRPGWIKQLAVHFDVDSMEFYIDPPHLREDMFESMYTIRCKSKIGIDTVATDEECAEIARMIEEAEIIGTSVPIRWRQIYGHHNIQFIFRLRQLEWSDVYPELMEYSWPRFNELMYDGERSLIHRTKWDEQIEKGVANPTVVEPSIAQFGMAQCWTDAYALRDRKIVILSLVGRKSHIEGVELGMKRGEGVSVGYYKNKLLGGGSKWKENYTRVMIKLPMTGAFHCLWIHKIATDRVDDDDSSHVFVPKEGEHAAKIIAGASGCPVPIEWAELITDKRWQNSGVEKSGVNGTFVEISQHKVMELLTNAAQRGELPVPTGLSPEVIRPVMPPSVGIWAQLALQGFANDIPLPGGIIMHATPLTIKDVDISEGVDKSTETTKIIRKDAVRFVVFHYKSNGKFKAGDWEIFETEREEEKEEEPENE